MNRSLLFVIAIAAPACVVDRLDFHEQESAEAVGSGGERSGLGTGGALAGDSGGEPVGPGGQCASSLTPFQRGGYGGDSETTVEAISIGLPPGGDYCCLAPYRAGGPSVAQLYDEITCQASSACLQPCSGEGEACEFPTLAGPLPGVCRTTSEEHDEYHCALPCVDDGSCPTGSVCKSYAPFGTICMIPETPHAPGCDPNFCISTKTEPRFPDGYIFRCDLDAPCCAGLTCNEGVCEAEAEAEGLDIAPAP